MLSIIEIKSEIGAGTRGASLGPDAVKVAALNSGNDLFFKHRPQHVLTENHLLHTSVTTPYGKRIAGLVRVFERVSKVVASELEKGKFALLLAGDHSTAGGTIAGLKRAFPDKRIGVVWIDAHADLHSPYSTPSGNLHGMPLATALGYDNLHHKVNEIREETRLGWEKLKNTGGMAPKILPQDLVFIGVRDTEEAEDYVIANAPIRKVEVAEVRQKGVQKIVEETLTHLAETDLIYVSFDVDSVDPSFSKGTGTPVPGGLEVEEASGLIKGLISDPKAICFEVVEVNPCLDDKVNRMAEMAFRIVEEVVQIVEKR